MVGGWVGSLQVLRGLVKLFATRSVLQSNTVKENGMYAFTHLKVELCIFGALAVHGSVFTFTD